MISQVSHSSEQVMCSKAKMASSTSTSTTSISSVATSVRRLRCLEPATHLVNGAMESLFFRLGYLVGRHPWFTIGLSLILCLVLGGGLFLWVEEHDSVALWTTHDSAARHNSEWVKLHFSEDARYETVIVSADNNVLRPEVLILLAEMDAAVRNFSTEDGYRWTDLCARFGTTLKNHDKSPVHRRRRQAWNDTDDMLFYSTDNNDDANADVDNNWDGGDLSQLDFSQVFDGGGDDDDSSASSMSTGFLGRRAHHLVNMLAQPDECLVRSILQIWDSDLERIRLLDQRQILEDVNAALLQGDDPGAIDSLEYLLSDVRRDANGSVIYVGATLMTWLLDNNPMNTSMYKMWEKDFIHQTLHSNLTKPADVRFYSLSSSSYIESIAETLTSNFTVLMAGFSLIIFYFSFAMGRFNWIEQRLVLSILGVSVVGQAILASYGLCFYFGIVYGPVHPIIPFLLLGIGVDDMFVIIQALDNLSNEEKQLPIPERMARALKHAGVSITVTSVTDIAAFAIGATTSMPALRSFCINAMAGILMLFVLEVTYFVALTVLDERRKVSRKIGCFFRPQEDWKPSSCSQRELLKMFFERFYGPFLLRTPVKVLILMLTVGMVSVNIWGILQLEQNFDPNWYLMENSYPSEYFNAMKNYFPENGERASVYTGRIDYIGQRDQLNKMTGLLRTNPFIHSNSVNFWYDDFQNWLNRTRQVDFPEDEPTFKELMQEYLFSPEGRHHLQDIKVEGSILDLDGNFNITGSRARFLHLSLKNATVKNLALESITTLAKKINFGSTADPLNPIIFTYIYVEWESNRVISNELIRNLGLTMVAVVSVTLVLISDLVTVFWVFTCIAFTLIDLLGLMYFWGLTIEISSSIIVILAAGLAIDYSAHIGHTFTTVRGSKSTRAKVTLTRMGPAVWNGGFSTFLAFVLLVNSDSHIFTTFFKLFFGVVVFGLFHGLAYLPVVLSCFGPEETSAASASGSSDSISTEFSSSPSSTSSDSSNSSASTPIQKKQSISALALDNPIFISDIQIVCYPNLHPLDIMNAQRANGAWKGRPAQSDPQLQKAPYIPQPDYTPLPVRRADGPTLKRQPQADTAANLSSPYDFGQNRNLARTPQSPDYATADVWGTPRWGSSQFVAKDWNALLMKRLSVEAKSHRDEKLRRQANKELDRFESEIQSYIEEEDEEQEDSQNAPKRSSHQHSRQSSGVNEDQSAIPSDTSTPSPSSTLTGTTPPYSASSASSSPRIYMQHLHPGALAATSAAAVPSNSSSAATLSTTAQHQTTRSGNNGSSDGGARRSRDRDQISLESGYMSSYPGDAQRHNGAF